MIKCSFCGRIAKNKNSNKNHELRCKRNPDKIPCGNKKGYIPWNTGLTKETNEILRRQAEKASENMRGKNNPFYGKKHSDETIARMKANPNMGGAGRGGGRGKAGWYNEYWCDSSWELAYVIYNIDHKIDFKRNKQGFEYLYEGGIRKYYPDFIENETYIEIKGYYDETWILKYESFELPLKVLYKKDMKKYLDYVTKKYGKDFVKLYEKT